MARKSLSREWLYPLHCSTRCGGRGLRFEGAEYDIVVGIGPDATTGRTEFKAVNIASFHEDKQSNGEIRAGRADYRHLGEFIFLLAAKLKCDLLSGIEHDAAGFLHSREISRLNERGLTRVAKTALAELDKLHAGAVSGRRPYRQFLGGLFVHADQLWNLVCYCGWRGSTAEGQDLVWWLNVGPADVEFVDESGTPLPEGVLGQALDAMLPGRWRLTKQELAVFLRHLDFPEERNAAAASPTSAVPGEASLGLTPRASSRRAERLASRFEYLKDMRAVLAMDEAVDPRWFRRTGPVAADFERGRVCRRPDDVRALRAALKERHVQLLEGVAASGKSVLVRELAYELLGEVSCEGVWLVDCKVLPHLDDFSVVTEARQAGGLVIVEDAHLFAWEVDRIYQRLRKEPQAKVLIVTRPSMWERLDEQHACLPELRSSAISLKPIDVQDEIIEHFRLDPEHSHLPWHPHHIDDIKRVSAESLWHLAYTLEGYVRERGAGNAMAWLAKGVTDELEYLGFKMQGARPEYPEVLVALSALYQNEVMTHARYLTGMLGLDLHLVNELVGRGDVTRVAKEEGVFYGLQHAARARAYWEYGRCIYPARVLGQQRPTLGRESDHEDFLHAYARAGLPNSLEAIARAPIEPGDRVVSRLLRDSQMQYLVLNEASAPSLALTVDAIARCGRFPPALLSALAMRISTLEDLYVVHRILDVMGRSDEGTGVEMLAAIDMDALAEQISRSDEVLRVAEIVSWILDRNTERAAQIVEKMDVDAIAWRMCGDQPIDHVAAAIQSISRAHRQIGAKLCRKLDLRGLADHMTGNCGLSQVCRVVEVIRLAEPGTAAHLLARVDPVELARQVQASEDVAEVGELIACVMTANKAVGTKLWRNLDRSALAKQIERSADFADVAELTVWVFRADEEAGAELWGVVDLDFLAERICGSDELSGVARLVRILFSVQTQVGPELLKRLDLSALARRVQNSHGLDGAADLISELFRADRCAGAELWENVNLTALAERLSNSEGLLSVARFIGRIDSVGRGWGAQLCGKLDAVRLAVVINRGDHDTGVSAMLAALWRVSREYAARLWGRLRIRRVAIRQSRYASLCALAGLIAAVSDSDREAGVQLCRKLDLAALAGRVAKEHCFLWSAQLIEELLEASPKHAKDLSARIDPDALAKQLSSFRSWPVEMANLHGAGALVAALRKASPERCEEVVRLLDVSTLAMRLRRSRDPDEVSLFIWRVSEADQSVGKRLTAELAKKAR